MLETSQQSHQHQRLCVGIAMLASILCGAVISAPALASPGGAVLTVPIAAHVTEAAQRFGIPEGWIWSVMRTESAGNRTARSPKGAMGLMQIMPATWMTLSARYGLGPDPFDVRANIHAGAAYLRQMWDRYGNVTAMLAAYNAGPARADAYVVGRGSLPGETRAYVARIAPAISGSAPASLSAEPPARPITWRQSMLFAAAPVWSPERAEAAGETHSVTTASRSDTRSTTIPPVTHGLFVPLSGQNRP